LPLSLEDVEGALQGGPFSDYVGRSAAVGSAAAIWSGGLSRVAKAIGSLAESATEFGVRVVLNARRQDLSELFKGCRVVTVLGHWRGPEIASRDLLLPPLELARRLSAGDDECLALLGQGLRKDWLDVVAKGADDRQRRSRLAELLDERLGREPALMRPPDGASWHMDAETLRHMNRAALDAVLPDGLVPGNRLELYDGLHAPDVIAGAVPETWAGIADLSSCQSAQLIEQIKQGRSDRVVVANGRATSPLLRIAVLQVVYELLADRAQNYAEVRQGVAIELTRSQHRR
jgi:hypothetical protein